MADVWLGRFSRWLEKLVNAKGGPALFDIEPGIRAVFSIQTGPEDLYLLSTFRFAQFLAVTAVAGQNSCVQIRNPAGSNVIAVIELLGIGPSVATVSTYHVSQAVQNTDFGTTARGFRLDARSNPQSTCVMSSGQSSDLANIILLVSGNNTNSMINASQGLPLTLLPGDTIRVTDLTVNEAYTVEMLWRERALESSELT